MTTRITTGRLYAETSNKHRRSTMEPTFILGTKPRKDSIKLDIEELQAIPEEEALAIFAEYKKQGYWFSLSNNSVIASL